MDSSLLTALAVQDEELPDYDPVEEYRWDWIQEQRDDEVIQQHLMDSEDPWPLWPSEDDEPFFSLRQLDADSASYPQDYM